MEYPRNDEEFYELMKRKREEIMSMNIPEPEKDRLYSLVEETIGRHEDYKKIDLAGSFKSLFDNLILIYENTVKIEMARKGIDKTVAELKGALIKLRTAQFKKENPFSQN